MPSHRPILALHEGIEIAERDWLICGLLWMAIGTLAVSPLSIAARAGRVLIALALCVHTTEAAYVFFRAWMARLSAGKWFLRTMVLGSLAFRRVPRRRSMG
jgi:hypothetical protein